MKKIKIHMGLLIALLGMMACNTSEGEISTPEQEGKGFVRLHIGANVGNNTRKQGSLDETMFQDDDLISDIEVYLLKQNAEGAYRASRGEGEPCVRMEYQPAVADIVLDIPEYYLSPEETYSIIVVANQHQEEGPKVTLFDANGDFNFNEIVTYQTSYFQKESTKKARQFLMTNASAYVGTNLDDFLAQYQFRTNANPSNQKIDIEICLDRLVSCISVDTADNQEEGLVIDENQLNLEEGLTLRYKDFTVFNRYLHDYLFKHLLADQGDIYIHKAQVENPVVKDGMAYIQQQWEYDSSVILNQFSRELALAPENSPFYQSKEGAATQGTTTGVLIRVVGWKEGKEYEQLYAVKREDKYYLSTQPPSIDQAEDYFKYEKGMFYTFYIQEPNLPLANEEPHYGVVRNTAYLLSIQSIKNPGGSKPFEDLPTPDPDSGIREDVSHIELHVQPYKTGDLNFN